MFHLMEMGRKTPSISVLSPYTTKWQEARRAKKVRGWEDGLKVRTFATQA